MNERNAVPNLSFTKLTKITSFWIKKQFKNFQISLT